MCLPKKMRHLKKQVVLSYGGLYNYATYLVPECRLNDDYKFCLLHLDIGPHWTCFCHIIFPPIIQGFHSCLELNSRKHYYVTTFLNVKVKTFIQEQDSIGILEVFKRPILFIPVFCNATPSRTVEITGQKFFGPSCPNL